MDYRGATAGIKLLIVGDANTGKSSMLRRFVHGEFTDGYKRTIGAEFLEKDVVMPLSVSRVRLMLWDTAGSDVFNAVTQSYYQGAGAAIVVFSSVDRASFTNVERWKQRIESVCGPITIILCQTKFDLFQQSAVGNEEAERLAMHLKVPFFRTSTKDDFNVTPLFEFTAQRCVEMWTATQTASLQPAPIASSHPAAASGAQPATIQPIAAAPAPAPATSTATPRQRTQESFSSSDSDHRRRKEKKKKKKEKSNDKGKCTTM